MLDRLFKRLRPPEAKASRTAQLIQIETGGRARWTPRDYAALAREGYVCNAIVHRAVKLVAENVAGATFLAYEGATLRDPHPLLELLARPNPRQERAAFVEAICAHLLLAGNAYVEAVAVEGEGTQRGRADVRELYALRPDRMRVVPGADGWPEAYEYVVGGRTLRFEQSAALPPILHLTQFHPLDDHYGLSSLEAAAVAVEGGDGTLRYKLSKESAAKTLSLLFQDDFEGRAEIGLTGDDDFHFKVSADGETWLDAIVIDHETGEVSLPQTPPAGAPADLDIVLAGLALGLADALNSATFLGASGNRFADSFDTLDYVDAVGATNLETGVAGQLRPAMNGIDLSYRTNLSSTSDLTTYTFSSVSLGAAAADRIIAVGVTGTAAAGANRTVSSVTIGGVSATKRAAAGEAANSPASIWAAVVPTGTTGDIAVTWDNAMVRCAGEVWRMTGAVETPLDSDALATGDPMNLAVDVAAGGAVLGFACNQSGSGPGGYGWTGLTGDHDATVETNTEYSGASQSIASGQSGYAVVADPGAAVGDVRAAVVSYEPSGGLLNMVVASEILTAASAPDDAKIVARIEQIDPVTLGTDLIFEVSRDGGTSWTEADMNERFTVGGITVLESDAIDMSGQPSGTDMLWRITTDNGVMVAIDDIYLYWN